LQNVTGERTGWQAWSPADAAQALDRYESRRRRLAHGEEEHALKLEQKAKAKLADLAAHTHGAQGAEADRKRKVIEAALGRARAKREQQGGG
jgi:electron transport complex protein RnfB